MIRPVQMFDVECYTNYFLVKFYNHTTASYREYEMFDGHPLDVQGLGREIYTSSLVGFNSGKYDMPMLTAALAGFSNQQLKNLSDTIITQNMQPWQVEQMFNITIPTAPALDHIDLFDVAPGMASLKIYGGRLHSKRMQDLPIEPGAILTREQMQIINSYCGNDLLTTYDLYVKLKPDIDLRVDLGKLYGIDLRSKSDAQIAESAFKKLLPFKVYPPKIEPGTKFFYKKPDFIQFDSDVVLEALALIERSPFTIANNGSPEMTDELANCKIKIGSSVYRLGIGGLHSSEKSVSHIADATYSLEDVDVVSYYPKIISILRMFPHQIGETFLTIYDGWIEIRIKYKNAGDKKKAGTFKIKINGTFGKTGSKYSILYAPSMMIQTTITGQLSLLMLIEMLESSGISVVSANTDGVVIKCRRDMHHIRDALVKNWERITGFETEANEYRALFSRDINNYLAFKPNGEVKAKGAYAEPGLQKNPTNIICVEAVTAHILDGVPPEKTIRGCSDIRKFVTVRAVKGGGVWTVGDVYLGKAVRWYYGRGQTGHIAYATNGNKVATSDGAKPCMELPDVLPPDIDYLWYIQETKNLLADINCC